MESQQILAIEVQTDEAIKLILEHAGMFMVGGKPFKLVNTRTAATNVVVKFGCDECGAKYDINVNEAMQVSVTRDHHNLSLELNK